MKQAIRSTVHIHMSYSIGRMKLLVPGSREALLAMLNWGEEDDEESNCLRRRVSLTLCPLLSNFSYMSPIRYVTIFNAETQWTKR